MKRIFVGIIATLYVAASFATTLSPITLLNPAGSTSGQAIVSTGASSAPAWGNVSISTLTGILPVAKGGTNASTASGTALDNITGFAGTGFMVRAGGGAYSFLSATNGIGLGNLAQAAANTVIGNSTGATGNLVAIPAPSCSAAGNALNWTSGTGFTCASGLATTASVTAAVAAVTPTVMTTYTPTVTAGSGTFTTTSATGRFYTIGKLVFFEATVTITTVGTAGGAVIVGLPATTNASGGVTSFAGHETAINGKMLTAISSASTSVMAVTNYDATAAIGAGFVLVVSGSYVSN